MGRDSRSEADASKYQKLLGTTFLLLADFKFQIYDGSRVSSTAHEELFQHTRNYDKREQVPMRSNGLHKL